MTRTQMRAELMAARDPSVAGYMEKVVSDTAYPMLYVRMDPVRRIAKRASKSYALLLTEEGWESFEEVLCVGLAIAYAKEPLQLRLEALQWLLPHLDSWALTDSIFPTLRFLPEERDILFAFAQACLQREAAYTVRSGIVILLRFFLQEQACPHIAKMLTYLRDDRYYVQMAVAWCFAEMAVQDFNTVEKVLKSGELDRFIHNKTIQKIRESYRIPVEMKEMARGLRRE